MKTKIIIYSVSGILMGVLSSMIFLYSLWFVYDESESILTADGTVSVSESTHSEVSKELRDTKVVRATLGDHFVTNDTFLSVFTMLDEIKHHTGAVLTVDSVNAETPATKNSLSTVRVVVTVKGDWETIVKTYKALSATPIVISVLSSDITATDKPNLFEGKAVLRVYIKSEIKS